MNKTITLITGAIVAIALTVFLALGEIDVQTYGTFAATSLGVIYGFYKKLETNEVKDKLLKTEELTATLLNEKQSSLKTLEQFKIDNNNLHKTINEWSDKFKVLNQPNVQKTKTNKKPKV